MLYFYLSKWLFRKVNDIKNLSFSVYRSKAELKFLFPPAERHFGTLE